MSLGRGARALFVSALLAFALVSIVSAQESPSASQPATRVRVVVERFRGTRAAPARSQLVASLEGAGFVVVPEAEVTAARRRLGLGARLSDGDYASLAREVGASAILDGRVGRARRAWSLQVRVRDGASGALLGSETWSGRTTAAIDGVGRNGAARLAELLGRARGATPPPPPEPAWYESSYPAPAVDEPPPPTPEPAADRYDVGRVSVSGGTFWRSFGTVLDVYLGQHDPTSSAAEAIVQQERSYTSAGIGHLEIGADGEFFPGALGDQPFPYLGLVGSFRAGVVSSRAPAADPVDGEVRIATTQLDVRAALRARYRFGEHRGDFLLYADAGYGYASFAFDLGQLARIQRSAILPPMEYHAIDLGLGFDVALVRDVLSLGMWGRGRVGVGIGTGARDVWGLDTGPANGFTLGVELRHEATWLSRGAFASLRVEYVQWVTQFRGQVGCYRECPGGVAPWADTSLWEVWPVADPTVEGSPVVGGALDPVLDHALRWSLGVGHSFD